MKHSEMTEEQRRLIVDAPENYPLRVSFLGKTGLLTLGEIAFLVENGVDFDVHDRQVAEILSARSREVPSPEG